MSDGEILIAPGATVTMHFILQIAGEDVVVEDTRAEAGEPFVFTVGEGALAPALESRLLGMKAGQSARFELAAAEAYGEAQISEDSIQSMPLDLFPTELEIAPGLVIGFSAPNGDEIAGTITAIEAGTVTVDFSHPLAGCDLVFEIEILAVAPPRAG